MRILLCAATSAEATACRAGIRRAHCAPHFSIVRTGIGPKRAAAAAFSALEEASPLPDLVVSAGFAFASQLPPGSFVAAARVFGAQRAGEAPRMVEPAPATPASLPRCDLLSVHRLRIGLPEIPDPADNEGPLVVDMESAFIAEAAAKKEVTFAAIRMVTDTPDRPLPRFVARGTDAAMADSTRRRLAIGARAAVDAALSPGESLAFVFRARRWCRELREGWTRIAPALVREISL